ncbi:hypothetical protein Tco_0329027 [Tanacetum coccineum]
MNGGNKEVGDIEESCGLCVEAFSVARHHLRDFFPSNKGIDLFPFVRKEVGNGEHSLFWDDIWLDEMALKHQYPRLYALESSKQISMADKMSHTSLVFSYHRIPRGGVEEEHQCLLQSRIYYLKC